jgi:hypothetical protein
MKSGKQKAMERANKSLQERIKKENMIVEGAEIGTPVVMIQGPYKGAKGTIVSYAIKLDNGERTQAVKGDFYNDTDPDLPF